MLVQHRAHGEANPGTVIGDADGALSVEFEQPVEAAAPGQSAALYSALDPDELLGGGIIAGTRPVTRPQVLIATTG